MSLRFKVLLLLGVSLGLFFVVVHQVLSYFVIRNFSQLEQQEMRKHTMRVADALGRQRDELAIKLHDWSQWDDTYQFIGDRNDAYLRSNIQGDTLALLRINTIVLTDVAGDVIFSRQTHNDQGAQSSEGFLEHLKKVIGEKRISDEVAYKAFIPLSDGVMSYVVRSVTSSDGRAPINGYIAFGYFVDQEVIDELARVTHLDVQSVVYDEHSKNDEFTSVWNQFSPERPILIEQPKDEQRIVGNAFFSDAEGRPIFLLRVVTERDIYRYGQESLVLFSWVLIGAIVLFSGLLYVVLNRLVLGRLSLLCREVEKIGQSGNCEGVIHVSGGDEFSILARHINDMLGALRMAEMGRKESEIRFRTVADSAPVMIWISDLDQQCTYVNKIWLDFTGRALDQELGQGWMGAIHPDDVMMSREAYQQAFAGQRPFSVEYRLRRHDGAYRWVLAHSVPYRTPDSVFLGYIGSCVDITDRKEAEEKNNQRIKEMESMNRMMVERELKMIELKAQIKKLQDYGK